MITLALQEGGLRVRTLLFTPATRPELTAKALAGPADAVVVDLEDSVRGGREIAGAGRDAIDGPLVRHLPARRADQPGRTRAP
ncbi:hypothetical protein GCM10023215_61890 [Pseudonocardia yuanmonensis]|uniref:HpcH/HpaI aldolase/citrate lyase family protein n=1 Tax=Pseudonocardia yuanmonensis TaxID=1095914 RepID=A0ABP8XNB9_9PSEU